MGDTDLKLFKDLESLQDSGCHDNQKEKKNKNLLFKNHWTDFNIILQKCPFSNPLPRFLKPSCLVNICIENFIKFMSSCRKPLN